MESEFPAYIQQQIERPRSRCFVAFGVFGLSVVGSLIVNNAVFALLSAGSSVVGFVLALQWLYRLSRLPRMMREHEQRQLRFAEAAKEREARDAEWRQRMTVHAAERELERQKEFLGALDLPLGERAVLETKTGSIWVTKCRDGTLRLWWQFESSVRELAVPVVKGRARYDPVGWFVNRGREAEVMAALSKI